MKKETFPAYVFYHEKTGALLIGVSEDRGYFWIQGLNWSGKAWATLGLIKIGYFGRVK